MEITRRNPGIELDSRWIPLFDGVDGPETTDEAAPIAMPGSAAPSAVPTDGAAPANADTPPVPTTLALVIDEFFDTLEPLDVIPSLTGSTPAPAV